MWSEPTNERLARVVKDKLYGQDGIPLSKQIVHAHFFISGCDWWVTEYNPEEDLAYGFTRLNLDDINSEWGYISIAELRQLRIGIVEVDFDRHWEKRPAGEIDAIKT